VVELEAEVNYLTAEVTSRNLPSQL